MIDRVGEKFGRLLVLSFDRKVSSHYYWNCLCDCGNKKIIECYQLTSGKTKSCGCLKSDINYEIHLKHGYSKNGITLPEYTAWANMIQRCTNPNNYSYYAYGAKGVTICNEWLNSF